MKALVGWLEWRFAVPWKHLMVRRLFVRENLGNQKLLKVLVYIHADKSFARPHVQHIHLQAGDKI